MVVSREQLDVVLRAADDVRFQIAALKVQRWDVVKWAATINIGLAAASAGFEKAYWAFLFCCVVIAGFGIGLVFYYNLRLTRVRSRNTLVHQFLRKNVIDLNESAGLEFGKEKGTDWDREEMKLFTFIIACSIFPAFLIWALG